MSHRCLGDLARVVEVNATVLPARTFTSLRLNCMALPSITTFTASAGISTAGQQLWAQASPASPQAPPPSSLQRALCLAVRWC